MEQNKKSNNLLVFVSLIIFHETRLHSESDNFFFRGKQKSCIVELKHSYDTGSQMYYKSTKKYIKIKEEYL